MCDLLNFLELISIFGCRSSFTRTKYECYFKIKKELILCMIMSYFSLAMTRFNIQTCGSNNNHFTAETLSLTFIIECFTVMVLC